MLSGEQKSSNGALFVKIPFVFHILAWGSVWQQVIQSIFRLIKSILREKVHISWACLYFLLWRRTLIVCISSSYILQDFLKTRIDNEFPRKQAPLFQQCQDLLIFRCASISGTGSGKSGPSLCQLYQPCQPCLPCQSSTILHWIIVAVFTTF